MQDTLIYPIIKDYLPWIMSIITLYSAFLAGSYKKHAWLVGLGNQLLWLVWILVTGTWGFLPMNLALWFVYGRNHWKWNQKDKHQPVMKYPAGRPKPLVKDITVDIGTGSILTALSLYDSSGAETDNVFTAVRVLCGSAEDGYYMVDMETFEYEELALQ